ncbi:MAG: tRNA dihydrouridine synthase DusB [Chlamydiae bacterium]|nr:tRNA dihydrouridine synthase DusB [Chlamydiota bacterium]
MRRYVKPLQLGKLQLKSNILYAPLAGCSDFPFRKMSYLFQPALTFCEMVKMDALVRHDASTYRILDFDKSMTPIGAQLCGSKPELAKEAAKIIEDLGFDVIDLNCGCPVDKVTKDSSGSGMLKSLPLIEKVLTQMVSAVSIPVTIKIRAGWDDNSIVAPTITKMAESLGVKMITIHGRTREQGYKGFSNLNYIQACKAAADSIIVIGNGDIMDEASAYNMFEKTGCDGILVARGTLGAPWIFEDIYRYLEGLPKMERTSLFIKEKLLQHLAIISSYQNPRRALTDMRRVSCWYLKNAKGTRALRDKINKSQSTEEILHHIESYAWQAIDFQYEEQQSESVCTP